MSSMKHQISLCGGGRSIRMTNNNKVKDLSSEGGDQFYSDEDFPGVFSWPPRSYTCSFCKREFRSAQALGGHMNVHRRDRARLRQSPPTPPPRDDAQHFTLPNLNLDPNPNTNFNINPSFSTAISSPFSSPPRKCLPFISSTSPPLFSTTTTIPEINHGVLSNTKGKTFFDLEKLGSIKHQREDHSSVNKAEIIRLELEIGLLGEAKDDLDLELRLGYRT